MNAVSESMPDWLVVSRETHEKLRAHWALVEKWSRTVNLISPASVADAWNRHVLDSAQVWCVARAVRGVWADIGSGGGFPGLVVAIMAQELAPEVSVTLFESDRRKAVFLKEAARQLDVDVDVRSERIESAASFAASVVSARALAPLDVLLREAMRLLDGGGVAVFPKGATYDSELLIARKSYEFEHETIPSKTDAQAVILRIWNIRNA